MLRLLSILLICCLSFSCKKAVERKQEQIVMNAITNGVWLVALYTENGVDLTTEYSGFEFKFNDNETLNAHTGGSTTAGTWKPDVSQLTITTNFPGATDPLKKLVSVWKLTSSDWDFVKSESMTDNIRKTLHLRKKS